MILYVQSFDQFKLYEGSYPFLSDNWFADSRDKARDRVIVLVRYLDPAQDPVSYSRDDRTTSFWEELFEKKTIIL